MFQVLEECAAAHRTLSLAELVARTGVPKTTLHRLCWKLVELGGLEANDGGFRVGTKLFALGGMHPDVRRLRALSMPYLHELCARSGWMANLAVRSGDEVLLVEELCCTLRVSPKMIGGTMPLHATAVGKALLFDASELDLARMVDRLGGLRPYTKNTIVRPGLLGEHLAKAAANGIACSREEWRLGMAGVAAPVYVDGSCVAAVALVGPPDERLLRQLAEPVRRAAARLGAAVSATAVPLAHEPLAVA